MYREVTMIELREVLRLRGEGLPKKRIAAQLGLPSMDPDDPDFRRLKYVRYADDFLLALSGPKARRRRSSREFESSLRTN
jgi:hypothetical protein